MANSESSSMLIKLESVSPNAKNEELADEEVDEDQCAICLQPIVDRTVAPTCSHEFCFECLMVWSEQSRRCPLCAQNIGDHLIHRIRSTYDYQKHFLPPLRTSPRPLARSDGARIAAIHRRRERAWGTRNRAAQDEADALERAVSRRRWLYQHNLYAKHVASNKYTRYRPCPTPAQFAASQDLISRMTVFLRRELLVWPNADVEARLSPVPFFLVTFVISLMKSIDIRSESAIKLLAEFLDMDTSYTPGERHVNAEHFAHGPSTLFHPHRGFDLIVYLLQSVYDSVVQVYALLHHTSVHAAGNLDHRVRSHPVSGDRGPIRIIPRGEQGDTSGVPSHVLSRAMTIPENQPVRTALQRPRTQVPSAEFDPGKRRATLRSPSPPCKNDEAIMLPSRNDLTKSSKILDTPTNSLRTRSLDSDIPSTSDTLSHGGRPKEASHPILLSPENNLDNNPVTSPQPHDGSESTTHSIDSAPLPSESREPFNLSVTGPNITPESYDSPTINDHPARTNPARRHRYRNQRDSIIAYLRSSSTSIPRFPTSVQPAPIPSPISDVMVAGIDSFVASTTEGQGGDEGGYARLASQRPERRPGPAVNDDSSVGKETGATRAQSSGVLASPISHLPRDGGR
ncbi:hypothetical protein EDB92DRAFT_1954303 [Lactarius akahatsu]|uniref:RING-type E3 ubiquitin transferase n=1 Tax=Lactarius akahatsu TaxID=416441 RepID=A0AAD4Q898_9AGAM|nr:hypothetical protein EDB92DRAFT_1954303 [Lactarius akahatsu]